MRQGFKQHGKPGFILQILKCYSQIAQVWLLSEMKDSKQQKQRAQKGSY